MSKKPARKAARKPARPSKPARKAPKKVAKRPATKAGRSAAKSAGRKSGASKAAPTRAAGQRAAQLFSFAQSTTMKYASGFSDDQLTHQPVPTSNHLLWNIGHLAISNQWFASMVDGQPHGVSDAWDALFGMKSRPVPDAGAYPSYAEVRAAYEVAGQRMKAAAAALTDAELAMPPAGETGGFLNDKLDAVMKAAWHEGWHLGQICEVRKALSLGPANG